MIINRTNLTNLNTGFKTTFMGAFGAVALDYQRLATIVNSSTSIETYAWLAQVPRMREWIGERFHKNLQSDAYTLRNKLYENTVDVPRIAIEDDQYGVYNPAIGMMAEAAAELPEELIFQEALPGGFATACFDGQNFFDPDHPVLNKDGKPVSVSNYTDGAQPAWYLMDVRRSIKPLIFQERVKPELIIHDDPNSSTSVFEKDVYSYGTRSRGAAGYGFWQMAHASKAELNAANFKAARTAMMKLTADHGKPLGVVPNLLVVSPDLEDAADEVLSVQRLANGQDNPLYKKAEILVSPWMAAA